MGRVHWTDPALVDVHEIMEFIARDSPHYAKKVGDRISACTWPLEEEPRYGPCIPEFDEDALRELLVYPYRVIYEIRGEDCYVLAVVHGSRELSSVIDPETHERR